MNSGPGNKRIATLVPFAVALVCYSGCRTGPTESGAGVPAAVIVLSGDAQTGTVGIRLGLPLLIRVVDGAGDPVVAQQIEFVVLSGGGSVAGEIRSTNQDGEAGALWTLGEVAYETQTVEARVEASSETGATPARFEAVALPGPPVSVEVLAGDRQVGEVGAALADSLVVSVADGFLNPVRGATVAWRSLQGGGTAEPGSVVTDSSGRAAVAWRLGLRVDLAHRIEAAVADVPPAIFTAAARSPANPLVLKGGDAQDGTAGELLGDSLTITVSTPAGLPVIGDTIVWIVQGPNGTVSPSVVLTDSAGRAATAWTLGLRLGAQDVQVRLTGTPFRPIFTAYAGPAGSLPWRRRSIIGGATRFR